MTILSPNKLYKDLDFSFASHPNTQDVLKKVDNNAIKQSIKSLLFTSFGERLFQPEVGSAMRRLLFEPIDPITTETLRKTIENTLINHEPRVKLELVDVFPNPDDNSYEVSIFFTALGVNQPTSLSFTLQRLR